MVRQLRAMRGMNAERLRFLERSIEVIPTLGGIHITYASRNPNKATGEANLGSSLFKYFAKELAELYHPLHCKSAVLCESPFGWLGGMAHPLEKKPNASAITDHRDIRLEDIPAKAQGIVNRPMLREIVVGTTATSQMGSGMHGGGTEPVFLTAQAAVEVAVIKGLSAATIYVDLKSAFSSV